MGSLTTISRVPVAAISLLLFAASTAAADHVNPCTSTATASPGVLIACPLGDGDELADLGLTVTVSARFGIDVPLPGVPASDIWLVGCDHLLALCGGSSAINASGPTDANGMTTITAAYSAGGCDGGGVRVVVMGVEIGAGECGAPCVPIKVRSPDINGDLVVNLLDLAAVGGGLPAPPKSYNECIDFSPPFGTVTLADFAKWALHAKHAC